MAHGGGHLVHQLWKDLSGGPHSGERASAELVAAILICRVGFTGLPVSTTQIVILLAWVLTLPVTIAVAAGLFYVLEG